MWWAAMSEVKVLRSLVAASGLFALAVIPHHRCLDGPFISVHIGISFLSGHAYHAQPHKARHHESNNHRRFCPYTRAVSVRCVKARSNLQKEENNWILIDFWIESTPDKSMEQPNTPCNPLQTQALLQTPPGGRGRNFTVVTKRKERLRIEGATGPKRRSTSTCFLCSSCPPNSCFLQLTRREGKQYCWTPAEFASLFTTSRKQRKQQMAQKERFWEMTNLAHSGFCTSPNFFI